MRSIRFVRSFVFLTLALEGFAPTVALAAAPKASEKSVPAGPVKQSDLDAPASVTKQVSLLIDQVMAREIFDAGGLSGEVLLSFIVDKSGKPKAIKVESGIGKVTDKAAVTAISKWRFKPAKKNGVIVEADIRQTIRLNLPRDYVPIYDSVFVDIQPVPLSTPRAVYPITPLGSTDLINASATVQFTVDSTGRTKSIYVLSSPGTAFSNAAGNAVATWRYRPGEVKGKPINTKMTVEVYFEGH